MNQAVLNSIFSSEQPLGRRIGVVHGTALTSAEFQKMAEVGADLAWSPLSNLLLYGDTTDVVAADQAGVRISLAPDWGRVVRRTFYTS